MYCQSCGAPQADDANFCSRCGTRLRAIDAPISEKSLATFNCDIFIYEPDEEDYVPYSAILSITNKRLNVKWENGLFNAKTGFSDTPLNQIKGVRMKEGEGVLGLRHYDLWVTGVGHLRFDTYENAAKAAQLISSLISN
jgi:hypothetical protein